jgi:hypothetical protein
VMPFAELCGHPFREADPGTQSGKVRSYAVGSPSIVWREARSSKKSAPPGGPEFTTPALTSPPRGTSHGLFRFVHTPPT